MKRVVALLIVGLGLAATAPPAGAAGCNLPGATTVIANAQARVFSVPGKAGFDPMDTKDYGLVELPSEERHGFIWGGKWYHYDTLHFEYRPGLLAAP